MELVGMVVKKTFPGFGTFTGTVSSYDASAGYFKIQYEDGDSEEVDHDEISSILESMGVPSPTPLDQPRKSNRGRPPKKRKKMEPDRDAGTELETDGVKGEKTETLVMDNGSSSVLEEAPANGGPLEVAKNVKMEELENCNGAAETEKKGNERGRKRQSLSGKERPTPVRRSTRRASVGLSSTPYSAPIGNVAVSEDADLGGSSVRENLAKPVLPPSSTDLDLDGLNVFDLFSAYTCLRSFSRLLFLSPFTLKAFVAALRCRDSNFLIDSVHYSILQAVKPHLEFLSEEGSESAKNCLRTLNWDLLNLVTWPVFLFEYLVINASRMKLSFKLSQLKLFDMEYYEQPAGVKLEILRCLCDDVVEVEAIRLELNRRMMDYEISIDASCNSNAEKKRKHFGITDPGSYLTQEALKETDDGNSDECCLCGMDGSLICCDGCPAAFHSRCVGVAKDLLPEGEWYCPECAVDKGDDKLVKLSKTFQGAEILGVDPHGRLYFATCDRLLVSGSRESDASYHYYNKNDLGSVINIMKQSYASYSAIINSISTYWGIHSVGEYGNNNHILYDGLDAQVQFDCALHLKEDIDGVVERDAIGTAAATENFGTQSSELPNLEVLNPMSSHQFGNSAFVCSEPLDEMVHAATCAQISEITATEYLMSSDAPAEGVISSGQTEPVLGSGKFLDLTDLSCTSLASDRRKGGVSHMQSDSCSYLNYYSLGRITSSIGKELMHELSENKSTEPEKPSQDLRSAQLKAISKKSIKLCWYTDDKLPIDAQKENCGWCVCCRTSTDDDCLFKVAYDKNLEGFKDKNLAIGKGRTLVLCSENNKKSHIAFAISHMLLIEDRVRGLLSGPWDKPHYSHSWRDAVLKASDAASLKPLLLSLESNLRRIALSVDWSKSVDSPCTTGSGSILPSIPVRASSNIGASRKQAKKINSGNESSLIFYSSKSSSIYWWRGGKIARQLFQWKILPRQLATKGGRQAGCKKIPNILYSDGSELAKRSKNVSWWAAVEMSQTVAQFIYQVQEFDANIKWMELSESRLFPQHLSKKVVKSWKKVIVRRKCTEGTVVKYLLDFGKKETLPAIVMKHGILFEESSTGRKRYWLNETFVPINLLKSFEERKIARSLKKIDSGTHSENGSKYGMKKKDRLKGFSYLMSRAQKFETELCGHCNKDVLVREAVNCQVCEGFFHRKHLRVPKGAIVTTYTCCKCKDKNNGKEKTYSLEGKLKNRKNLKGEKSQAVPNNVKRIKVKCNDKGTQDRPKKDKLILVINKNSSVMVRSEKRVSGRKRDSRGKFIKEMPENPKENNIGEESVNFFGSELSWRKRGKRGKLRKKKRGNVKDGSLINYIHDLGCHKRKRSVMHYSFWVNGLLWTQKPVNEQRRLFREKNVILPSQNSQDPCLKPVCCLCLEEFNSGVIYIGCQNCGDWFHGDAFCLTVDNIKNVIGFKCHSCRMRNIPMCPFSKDAMLAVTQSESRCNVGVDTLGVEDQDGDKQFHGGSCENSLLIVDNEHHMREKQREDVLVCSAMELVLNLKTISGHVGGDHQNYEHDTYEDASINGHIVGTNSQNEELDYGACGHGSAIANHLKGEETEDVHTPSQQLNHVQTNATSVKHGNEIQVEFASQEMREDLHGRGEVTDALLVGKLSDSTMSHSQAVVPTQKLDDLEGVKT